MKQLEMSLFVNVICLPLHASRFVKPYIFSIRYNYKGKQIKLAIRLSRKYEHDSLSLSMLV